MPGYQSNSDGRLITAQAAEKAYQGRRRNPGWLAQLISKLRMGK